MNVREPGAKGRKRVIQTFFHEPGAPWYLCGAAFGKRRAHGLPAFVLAPGRAPRVSVINDKGC